MNPKISQQKLDDHFSYANRKEIELASSLNKTIHNAMHDLKSPLSVIKPYVDFLKRVDDNERQEAILNRMKVAVEKMEVVINRFVKYSDLLCEANPKAEKIIFKKVYDEVYKEIDLQYAGLQSEITLQDDLLNDTFSYPSMYLKMILKILLDNAYKYRSLERILKVKISVSKINDDLLLEIKDNGVGFPDSFSFDEAFIPFAKNTNPQKGTGLGLASLKYIVEKNKGEIYGSSSEDGTAFIIKLKPYQIFESAKSIDIIADGNAMVPQNVINIARVS